MLWQFARIEELKFKTTLQEMNLRLSEERKSHMNTGCIFGGQFLFALEALIAFSISIIGLVVENGHISEELLEATSLAVQVFERTEELFPIHDTKLLEEVAKVRHLKVSSCQWIAF